MGLALVDRGSQEAEVPVKRKPPVRRKIRRLTWKSAAKTKAWTVGLRLAASARPPATTMESMPPKPM